MTRMTRKIVWSPMCSGIRYLNIPQFLTRTSGNYRFTDGAGFSEALNLHMRKCAFGSRNAYLNWRILVKRCLANLQTFKLTELCCMSFSISSVLHFMPRHIIYHILITSHTHHMSKPSKSINIVEISVIGAYVVCNLVYNRQWNMRFECSTTDLVQLYLIICI